MSDEEKPIPQPPSPPARPVKYGRTVESAKPKTELPIKPITPPQKISIPLNPETRRRTMSFPEGMKKVIDGKKIRREAWGNAPDYCYLRGAHLTILRGKTFHSWIINDGDMYAQDWVVYAEKAN